MSEGFLHPHMAGLESVSQSTRRLILGGIVLYFVLTIYASSVNDVMIRLLADVVFGVVALALGTILFNQAEEPMSAIGGSGICLTIGGFAQLGWVISFFVVPMFFLNGVASIAVFAGIGLYVYGVWIAD